MNGTQVRMELDWSNTVHSKERSSYGQAHLDKKRKAFGGQNKRVFEYLISGNEIDDDIARSWTPEIRHLHSRISDLVNEMRFQVSKKPHPTKNLTVYYCTEEQKVYNKLLLQKRG